jgi:hypothetical protein
MKIDPATIKVGHIDSGAMSIGFETADARYHIWVVQATGELSAGIGRGGNPVLYKNSLHAYGHPEHYQTRYLDPEGKANKKIVEQLIALSAPAVEAARAELAR